MLFPAGEYLSHSVRLKSRVALVLGQGATLVAADPPADGETIGYDAPEDGPPNMYQDFGHSRFRNSLIWGENLEGVAIYGPGRIFGRGLSRGNGRMALPVGAVAPQPGDRLPDVLEADGEFEALAGVHPVSKFGYPHSRDTLPAGVGNKAIALRGCRNVVIRDLTILHGGHFAILVTDCDNVIIDSALIDTNRDGIDIDACRNVRISNCSVNSPWDDGICIKSSCGFGGVKPVENVTVSDCYVSGFVEGTLYDGSRARLIQHRGGPIGRIKLGTESSGGYRNIAITNCVFNFCRGLALEQVDGAMMEDIVVSNLTMRDVMNAPIFIRLGARLRAPGAVNAGTARRISISNVTGQNVAVDHGVFIAGLPGNCVEDVRLSGMSFHFAGGGSRDDAERRVPEMPEDYPEPMLFGRLPSWGFFARHVRGMQARDLDFRVEKPDARPAFWLEDVAAADFSHVRLPAGGAVGDWVLRDARRVRLRDCDGVGI